MKKTILLLLLQSSVAIICYSQDVIMLTTRYLYDYSDSRAYVHNVMFQFEGNLLTISESENRTNIGGVYRIISFKEKYSNELGTMLSFLVEEITSSSNKLPKQYVLTQSAETIHFMPRTDSYNPERYVYLFEKPDM